MSAAPDSPEGCARCGAPLPPLTLACPACHALVHAGRLEELSASARGHEARGELGEALADWQAALPLLPPESSQAQWIRARIGDLEVMLEQKTKAGAPQPGWARKFGPLAPLLLFLAKGKFFLSLLKLKFLLSFVAFAGLYWALYGLKFGIGFALLILLHEFGHFIEVKRRGLPADLPVFIPGVGAYVRWTAAGVTPEARAFVSLAGPLAGAIGAVCCALVFWQTHEGLWIGLASLSALVNLLNLIPLWALDGGQALVVVNRAGRIGIAIAALMFAWFFSQPMLLLVAGGAIWRAFERELDPDMRPYYGVTAYYVILLAVLSYLATLAQLGLPPR